jgi:hypothetical protein
MKTLNVKSTADDLNAETIIDTRTLALPDGVSVSRTALVCSQQLSLDEWQSLGRALTQMESSIQWWIGDWWHYGRHRYGERKAKITAENAFERSYAFSTLMNYGWIAGRFKNLPTSRGFILVAPLRGRQARTEATGLLAGHCGQEQLERGTAAHQVEGRRIPQ